MPDKSKGAHDTWLMRRALMTAARELGLGWHAIGLIFNMERSNVRRMILDHKQRMEKVECLSHLKEHGNDSH